MVHGYGLRQWGLGVRVALILVIAVGGTAALGAAHVLRDGTPAGSAPSASPSSSPEASGDPFGPRYPIVTQTGAIVRGVPVQVHVPMAESAGRETAPLPLAVLLPARGIDPTQYAQLAHDLAAYGLVVVIADDAVPDAVGSLRAWARSVDRDPTAYLAGTIDPRRTVVVATGDGADAFGATTALTLPHALALTDEGRTGARTNEPIDARREDVIASVARTAAWTLLATIGDATARDFMDRATTPLMQSAHATAHN